MFITLDGGDGCGKSTQQKRLGHRFQSQGYEVVLCHDPGSTALGNEIRHILLHGHELRIDNKTEMFLFMAARAQMVEEVIRPALNEKKIVISDRFLLSNFVYQGYAGGIPLDTLETVGQIAVEDIMPDLAVILDIPYEIAAQRIGNRNASDRMEQKGEKYHRQVRNGFLQYAAIHPNRYVVIDAVPPPNNVEMAIQNVIHERYGIDFSFPLSENSNS
ncbi:MAG: dTMP kinase [Planctomycetaceae bacterium]|jgi:dTMP kinase|nr:dTMP kinase [Planctomycetaceae bacterium]